MNMQNTHKSNRLLAYLFTLQGISNFLRGTSGTQPEFPEVPYSLFTAVIAEKKTPAGNAQGIEVEILFCLPGQAKKIGTDSPVLAACGKDAPKFFQLNKTVSSEVFPKLQFWETSFTCRQL
jgi:hypothetical protein